MHPSGDAEIRMSPMARALDDASPTTNLELSPTTTTTTTTTTNMTQLLRPSPSPSPNADARPPTSSDSDSEDYQRQHDPPPPKHQQQQQHHPHLQQQQQRQQQQQQQHQQQQQQRRPRQQQPRRRQQQQQQLSFASESPTSSSAPLSFASEPSPAETEAYRAEKAREILDGPWWEFCVADHELRLASEAKRAAEERRTVARDQILPLLRVAARPRIDLSVLPADKLETIGGIGFIDFVVRRRVSSAPALARMSGPDVQAAVIEGLVARRDLDPEETVETWKRQYLQQKYPQDGQIEHVETVVRRRPVKRAPLPPVPQFRENNLGGGGGGGGAANKRLRVSPPHSLFPNDATQRTQTTHSASPSSSPVTQSAPASALSPSLSPLLPTAARSPTAALSPTAARSPTAALSPTAAQSPTTALSPTAALSPSQSPRLVRAGTRIVDGVVLSPSSGASLASFGLGFAARTALIRQHAQNHLNL
jgi:hypothetical protein